MRRKIVEVRELPDPTGHTYVVTLECGHTVKEYFTKPSVGSYMDCVGCDQR